MGKNKLKKFADIQTFSCVLQYPWATLRQEGFPLKGNWNKDFFKNSGPVTLELGCGKGEYTVALSEANPDRNFIGIDIKGARLWNGARAVELRHIPNAAFLRTDITLLDSFFAPGEVSQIWITFPDPQMQKTRRRLTSPRFLEIYRRILAPGGIIHLKTDSPFLYAYTSRLASACGLDVIHSTPDLYGSGLADSATSIKTFYECQWLSRGKRITYISFRIPPEARLCDVPEDDIPRDDYHSFPRGIAQCMPGQLNKINNSKL